MENKQKISFDFDSTLTISTIQDFAKNLVESGFEVWVVTDRFTDEEAKRRFYTINHNKDVFRICDEIGIKREHIKFCNMVPKDEFFNNSDFIWHLDDDWEAIKDINEYTKTIGITHFGNKNWKEECSNLLNI